jgi:hypothetical protein
MATDRYVTVSIAAGWLTMHNNPNPIAPVINGQLGRYRSYGHNNQEAGQTDPTNTSPIHFTVVFSEPVSNFATGDVIPTGTAGATTASVTGSGTTYDVSVSGMTLPGTVIAGIAAGWPPMRWQSKYSRHQHRYGYPRHNRSRSQSPGCRTIDPTSTSPASFTVVFSKPFQTSPRVMLPSAVRPIRSQQL